ncbi:MAG: hypothetical protein U0183_17115 [Polyangiaceae bacterium]
MPRSFILLLFGFAACRSPEPTPPPPESETASSAADRLFADRLALHYGQPRSALRERLTIVKRPALDGSPEGQCYRVLLRVDWVHVSREACFGSSPGAKPKNLVLAEVGAWPNAPRLAVRDLSDALTRMRRAGLSQEAKNVEHRYHAAGDRLVVDDDFRIGDPRDGTLSLVDGKALSAPSCFPTPDSSAMIPLPK